MALETLKDVEQIGGFEVKRVAWTMPSGNFIEVDDISNSITFKIQDGPVKEKGKNGCQVDTIIAAAAKIIEGLNKQFPCEENVKALAGLSMALTALEDRRLNREKRGVEGFATA